MPNTNALIEENSMAGKMQLRTISEALTYLRELGLLLGSFSEMSIKVSIGQLQ